jgi:hypothetical protein
MTSSVTIAKDRLPNQYELPVQQGLRQGDRSSDGQVRHQVVIFGRRVCEKEAFAPGPVVRVTTPESLREPMRLHLAVDELSAASIRGFGLKYGQAKQRL